MVWGDELACVDGTIVRLGQKSATGGSAIDPAPLDTPISVRGLIPALGAVSRTYQVWYRNAAVFWTGDTFSPTNGVEALWAP